MIKKFLSCAYLILASCHLVAEEEFLALTDSSIRIQEAFAPKNYTHLKQMVGFNEKAIELHIKLYEGYVRNLNLLLGTLQDLREKNNYSIAYLELKKHMNWELDSIRLHEAYFDALGGDGILPEQDSLMQLFAQHFVSFEAWKKEVYAMAATRGIGWIILYQDPVSKKLFNVWVNEHDQGHMLEGRVILAIDLWEHAYMLDYGINRQNYLNAVFKNLKWDVIKTRLMAS